MAKKQEEKVVEVATEEPKIDDKVEKLKIKKKPKMKNLGEQDEVVKVDLSKEVKEEITKIDLSKTKEEVVEDVVEEIAQENVLEEITEEKQPELPKQSEQLELPEGVNKLVDFMKDTGGDLNDYMRLNQNYDEWDSDDIVRAYYRDTKPHLSEEEISFVMEDNFKYDERLDDEKDIKRKKLALKEQVASAKSHLDGLKSKYYEDLKMGSKLNEEQQDAVRFFKESRDMQKIQEQAQTIFIEKTENVFNENFKGFEYNVGDKRFRFNVGDVEKVKNTQVDINNFVRKFLNKDNQMDNAEGYHKGLFTAMNSDAIANHFYEQGKADALKESISKSKNINMDPRQSHGQPTNSGLKVKILGDNSSGTAQFKFKKK
jgi:hypothetical protein